MSEILVSGLINLETTLRVDGFPIEYSPVRYPFFGVNSSVSGVGYNVAKALSVLGDRVHLLSMTGTDATGDLVHQALEADGLPAQGVLARLQATPQSVILYDGDGRRQINVDLKDVQESTYPAELFDQAAGGCCLAALCNVNFSRPMLARAQAAGLPVATDVHALADLEDEYNRDFMRAASLLFLSDECLPLSPEEFVRAIWQHYRTEIVVIGLGVRGALLGVRADGFLERFPAVYTRPPVNTIGAGDALFSAFIHSYVVSGDPYNALERAQVFASYKIGATSAADGFLDPAGLEAWLQMTRQNGAPPVRPARK